MENQIFNLEDKTSQGKTIKKKHLVVAGHLKRKI